MQFQSLISPIAFALTAIVLFYCQTPRPVTSSTQAIPLNTTASPYTKVRLAPQENSTNPIKERTTEDAEKAFRLSSRFHLKKGSAEGFLIVKFELPNNSYIYSLTQPEPFVKTTIKVTPSPHFSFTGKKSFAPDQKPKIIESDPDFGKRLEKHSGVVQFFIPIKLNEILAAKELTIQLEVDGQVCDETTCLPISGKKTTAKFAGFFEPTDKKSNAASKPTPKKK